MLNALKQYYYVCIQNGNTALHIAAEQAQVQAVNLLVKDIHVNLDKLNEVCS